MHIHVSFLWCMRSKLRLLCRTGYSVIGKHDGKQMDCFRNTDGTDVYIYIFFFSMYIYIVVVLTDITCHIQKSQYRHVCLYFGTWAGTSASRHSIEGHGDHSWSRHQVLSFLISVARRAGIRWYWIGLDRKIADTTVKYSKIYNLILGFLEWPWLFEMENRWKLI